MFEVSVDKDVFDAVASGRKRHHTLVRFIGVPSAGDPIRIAEVDAQKVPTNRACFARVLYVETLSMDITVLSIDVRMSTDRMTAVRDG